MRDISGSGIFSRDFTLYRLFAAVLSVIFSCFFLLFLPTKMATIINNLLNLWKLRQLNKKSFEFRTVFVFFFGKQGLCIATFSKKSPFFHSCSACHFGFFLFCTFRMKAVKKIDGIVFSINKWMRNYKMLRRQPRTTTNNKIYEFLLFTS